MRKHTPYLLLWCLTWLCAVSFAQQDSNLKHRYELDVSPLKTPHGNNFTSEQVVINASRFVKIPENGDFILQVVFQQPLKSNYIVPKGRPESGFFYEISYRPIAYTVSLKDNNKKTLWKKIYKKKSEHVVFKAEKAKSRKQLDAAWKQQQNKFWKNLEMESLNFHESEKDIIGFLNNYLATNKISKNRQSSVNRDKQPNSLQERTSVKNENKYQPAKQAAPKIPKKAVAVKPKNKEVAGGKTNLVKTNTGRSEAIPEKQTRPSSTKNDKAKLGLTSVDSTKSNSSQDTNANEKVKSLEFGALSYPIVSFDKALNPKDLFRDDAGKFCVAAYRVSEKSLKYREILIVDKENNVTEIWKGFPKSYYYSQKGYLYLFIRNELTVYDGKGQLIKTWDKGVLSQHGIKNIKQIMGSRPALFLKTSAKEIIEIPIKGAYDLDFDQKKLIPFNNTVKHYHIATNALGELFGLMKMPINKEEKEGNRQLMKFGVNRIDQNGDTSQVLNFTINSSNLFKSRNVLFLEDGNFLLYAYRPATRTKAYYLIDKKGDLIHKAEGCIGCENIHYKNVSKASEKIYMLYEGYPGIGAIEFIEDLGIEKLTEHAVKLFEDGYHNLAFQYAEKVLAIDSDFADARFVRGATRPGFRLYRDFNLGEPKYGHSIERGMFEVAFMGIQMQEEIENRAPIEQQVIADLKAAIAGKSQFTGRAEYILGDIDFAKKQYKSAYFHYGRAKVFGHTPPEIYPNLIESGVHLRRFKDCLGFAQQMIIKQPENPEAPFFRGVAFYKLGRYQEALADFNLAISKRSNRLFIYNRGLVHLALNNVNAACKDFTLAFHNGIKAPHYYLYNHCGFNAKEQGCELCKGSGNGRVITRDPDNGPTYASCERCGGGGSYYVKPSYVKLDVLMR